MKFVFERCGSMKATLRVTLDAGSAVEYGGKWTSGLAHVVEHMIFQGTNSMNHAELTQAMGRLGVDWNGSTWHAKVNFYVTAPAENILEAAKLLHGMLHGRKFDGGLLKKEKLVVLEEERGGRDDIDSVVSDKFNKFICDGPISVPIIGTAKSIRSVSLEEVQAFYNKHYRPANMLVVLTGPDTVPVGEIEELFGGNTDGFRKSRRAKNKHTKAKNRRYAGKVQQARIYVAFKTVPVTHRDALVLAFIDKFFGDDMDSRLFQSLRQKHGLCYGCGGWVNAYDDIGWYVIWTKTNGESVQKSLSLIGEEVDGLVSDGPTDEEMTRARNKYLSEVYSFLETSSGTNALVAAREFNGLPNIGVSLDRVRDMDASQIMHVCAKYFRPENMQVFSFLPK